MRQPLIKAETMAEPIALPIKPTNADLANALVQLHDCLETHKRETIINITEIKDVISNTNAELGKTNTKLETTNQNLKLLLSNQTMIVDAFKINKEDIKPLNKPIAMLPQHEVLFKLAVTMGASFSAILVIWKICWTIWPFVWAALIAIAKMAVK